jgi:hypothetical protein
LLLLLVESAAAAAAKENGKENWYEPFVNISRKEEGRHYVSQEERKRKAAVLLQINLPPSTQPQMLQEKKQKPKTYLHTVIDVTAGAIAAPAVVVSASRGFVTEHATQEPG